MKLYSTRHGESVLNIERKVAGWADVALTKEGILQAEALAKQLADVPIDAIIASPLIRARHTAEIIARKKGLPVTLDDRLKEQAYGILECGSLDDPEFQFARRNIAYKVPGGETLLTVVQRVYNFLDEIRRTHSDKTVLIVSHSVVCKVIHSYFTVLTDEEFMYFRCGNCELKKYEY